MKRTASQRQQTQRRGSESSDQQQQKNQKKSKSKQTDIMDSLLSSFSQMLPMSDIQKTYINRMKNFKGMGMTPKEIQNYQNIRSKRDRFYKEKMGNRKNTISTSSNHNYQVKRDGGFQNISVSTTSKNTIYHNNPKQVQKQDNNEFRNLKSLLYDWVNKLKDLTGIRLRVNGNSDFQFNGNLFKDLSIKVSNVSYSIQGYKRRFNVLILQKIYINEKDQGKGYARKLIKYLNEIGKLFNPRRFVLIESILNEQWFQSMRKKNLNYFPIQSDDSSMLYIEDVDQIQQYRQQQQKPRLMIKEN